RLVQVLDPGGQTMQRPERFALARSGFRIAGKDARPFQVDRRDGVDRRIERPDPRDRRLQELDRRDFLRADPPPQLDRRQRQQRIRMFSSGAARLHCNRSIRPCSRRVRGSIDENSRCSWLVWAPSPSTPSPSSVGIPISTVKLPSEPPPTSGTLSSTNPISRAISAARSKTRSTPRSRANGGRVSVPVTIRAV